MTDPLKPPPGKLSPRAAQLFELADELAAFGNAWTEKQSFEDYDSLREQESKLVAYANLLSTFNIDGFLDDEITASVRLMQMLLNRLA